MASLWVISGSRAGQSVPVTSELIIGRRNADLTIDDDPGVSRRHAAVRLDGGQLEIEDLGSANGTFVNGSRIEGPVKVGGGAKLRVGRTEFEVRGVLPARGAGHESATSPIADPQATRVARADPQVTRATPRPDPAVTRAAPRPDPEVTRAAPRADPQVTQASPRADPQVTQASPRLDPQVTQASPRADPQVTRASPRADPQTTQASSQSVLDTSPPIGAAPAAPAPGASANAGPQVGAFSAPARRRGRGLASRSWVPTVASFGTAIAAAAGLVVYFIVHGVPS